MSRKKPVCIHIYRQVTNTTTDSLHFELNNKNLVLSASYNCTDYAIAALNDNLFSKTTTTTIIIFIITFFYLKKKLSTDNGLHSPGIESG
jgi:hypothetical protein